VINERDSVLHSWCVPAQWQAPTIVGGRGAHFWDADGHDYLDMSSLSECSNLGHQHPTVVKAIREQAPNSRKLYSRRRASNVVGYFLP